MNCPACSHSLSPGARFCNKCGTLVSQPAPIAPTSAPASASGEAVENASFPCSECGKPLRPGARFCTGCGSLTDVAADVRFGSQQEAGVSVAGLGQNHQSHQAVEEPVVPEAVSFDMDPAPSGVLPIHPVKRGDAPDFELPDLVVPQEVAPVRPPAPDFSPRTAPESAQMPQMPQVPQVAPVSFDRMDDFAELERQANDSGSGLKWMLVAVAALLLIGGGGWFGYQRLIAPGGDGVEAAGATAARPAVDDVAEGESVVPAQMEGSDPGEAVEASDAAAATASTEPVPSDAVAVDAAVPAGLPPPPSEPAPAKVEPIHVLQDVPATVVPPPSVPVRPERRKSDKSSLDSLLD